MSIASNWRDEDEGYWIGVVEGMEAAAKVCDGRSNDLHPMLEQRAATYGRASLAIRESVSEIERARWGAVDPKVCACGHTHFADADGTSGECRNDDCPCVSWEEVTHDHRRLGALIKEARYLLNGYTNALDQMMDAPRTSELDGRFVSFLAATSWAGGDR